MPAALAIKQALDNYNDAKQKKEDILSGMVQELANLNMIEDLMAVHTGNASKDTVFAEKKEEYNNGFTTIASQEDLVKAANNVIKSTWDQFKQLKNAVQVDPTR